MLVFTEKEVQALKSGVIELEQQLKEAQATIPALTLAKEDKVQASSDQQKSIVNWASSRGILPLTRTVLSIQSW